MANTVHEAMTLCGINDVTLFNGQTKAERIAEDIFDHDFASCMDKTVEELQEDFKTFLDLAVNQGQIRLTPGTKKKIRAFMQWCKDEIRFGRDPSDTPFPVGDTTTPLRRAKTHKQFVSKSKTLLETAKPEKLTPHTK